MIYLKEAWYLFSVKKNSSRLLLVVAMQCASWTLDHSPFQECKATTLCQLRWKADQIVLTWFRNNVHDNQELPESHKKCTKKKLIQSLTTLP